MNLLDTIRQNSQKMGMTDETQKTAQLLRAKSGKSGAATPQSNLGEAAAVDAGNAELGQTNQANQLIQSNLEQKQMELDQSQKNSSRAIETERNRNQLESRLQVESVLRDLERDMGKVDMNRDQARFEQVASGLRFQNQQYMDNLEREGKRSRLDDKLAFDQHLQQAVYDDSLALLQKHLGNKSILDMDDREFEVLLAKMDSRTLWREYQDTVDAARKRAPWVAATGATTSIIGSPLMGGQQQQQTNMTQNQTAPTSPGTSSSYYSNPNYGGQADTRTFVG
jgi:hypothetical protein